MNKITGMKRNDCSFSNLIRNTFVFISLQKKIVENENKNLFLVNVDIF